MVSQFVKEGLPFAWDLSLENSADSYLCFRLALLHSVSYFFFLFRTPSSSCTVFDSISSNIDEVLSINPSANVTLCSCHASLAKWLSVRLQTKWFWVRVQLQSLKHLQMCLSFESFVCLTPIIRTGLPILVELIDLL